jgi:hypothetical protein
MRYWLGLRRLLVEDENDLTYMVMPESYLNYMLDTDNFPLIIIPSVDFKHETKQLLSGLKDYL